MEQHILQKFEFLKIQYEIWVKTFTPLLVKRTASNVFLDHHSVFFKCNITFDSVGRLDDNDPCSSLLPLGSSYLTKQARHTPLWVRKEESKACLSRTLTWTINRCAYRTQPCVHTTHSRLCTRPDCLPVVLLHLLTRDLPQAGSANGESPESCQQAHPPNRLSLMS